MTGAQRHRDATGAPDAALHQHVVDRGLDQERDPRFAQVGARAEQRCRHRGGTTVEVGVG